MDDFTFVITVTTNNIPKYILCASLFRALRTYAGIHRRSKENREVKLELTRVWHSSNLWRKIMKLVEESRGK